MRYQSCTGGTAAVLVALVAASGLAGCSNGSSASPPSSAPPSRSVATSSATPFPTEASQPPVTPIRWSGCGAGLQCGTVAVPRDYASAGSPLLSIAVTRHRATGASRGTLVVDFGGPGVSGAQTLRLAAGLLPARLQQQFDLVSFDPRGSGQSAPLRCTSGANNAAPAMAQLAGAVGVAPIAAAGEPLPADAVYRTLYAGCKRYGAALLPTVGSSVQARDLERIRMALGVAQLRYLGLSYGSVLGFAYAKAFPRRVAAMLLDGPVDPTQPIGELADQQAAAAEAALASAFRGPLRSAAPTYRALEARLRRGALPASGASPAISLGDLQYATLTYLAMPALSSGFPAALTSALAGSHQALQSLAAGQFEDADGSSILGAYWATVCSDQPERPSAVAANTASRALAARYPRLGAVAYVFAGGGCGPWAAASAPVGLPGSDVPIALVGGTGDPVTPYASASGLAAKLPSAVLIKRVGIGHTSFTNSTGDRCLTDAETAFFLNPSTAVHRLTCTDPAQPS